MVISPPAHPSGGTATVGTLEGGYSGRTLEDGYSGHTWWTLVVVVRLAETGEAHVEMQLNDNNKDHWVPAELQSDS